MRIIIFLACAILFFSCSSNKTKKASHSRSPASGCLPTIGQRDPNLQKVELDYMILKNSGTISKAYWARKDQVDYLYCVNSENIVTYIATYDKKFVTSELVKIGSSYLFLKSLLPGSSVSNERGWAAFVKLPSGWYASFGYEPFASNNRLRNTDTVVWFFKR